MNLLKKGILVGLTALVFSNTNAQELSREKGKQIVHEAAEEVLGFVEKDYQLWFGGYLTFDSYVNRLYAPSVVYSKMKQNSLDEIAVDYNADYDIGKIGLPNVDMEFRYVNMPAYEDSASLYDATVDTLKSILE